MGKFDLEANSDGIVPFFTGDVEDEATTEKDMFTVKLCLHKTLQTQSAATLQSLMQSESPEPTEAMQVIVCMK